MCVLALFQGVFADAPLIVAANRDEALDRPSGPPQELEPGTFGGKDLLGGGTWFAVNANGILVAVTNRYQPPRLPESLSRGLLTLEATHCKKVACIEAMVAKRTDESKIAGFNLVATDGHEGLCAHWDGTLRTQYLEKGTYVVSTNRDVNDPAMPEKVAFDRFAKSLTAAPTDEELAAFLGSHDGDRPICKHGDKYGTVSSSIFIKQADGVRLLHAAGPPCKTPFVDYTHLFGV